MDTRLPVERHRVTSYATRVDAVNKQISRAGIKRYFISCISVEISQSPRRKLQDMIHLLLRTLYKPHIPKLSQ